MEREERARFVAVDPSTYCSPRSETSSNVSLLRLSRVEQGSRRGQVDVTPYAILVGSARDYSGTPYRGASSDRSCAILKHPFNLKKGFQVSNPIRVAVLGFWHVHAAEYAARVREHPDTELVAVWDDDLARGQAAADAAVVPFVHNLDALLARDDLDAVTVTTATTEHHAIMLRVIQAGKHIFTEKLLAPTVAEAEEIVAAADNASLALVVSLPMLYHGYTRAIVEQLDEQRLGDLTYCRIRLSHDGAVAGWLPERFYDPAVAIGGALSDLGCHPVYLTQLFLGAAPATVSATYASFTKRQVEDQAVVTLEYADGVIGVVETGFVSNNPFTIEMHGTRASLAYDSTRNQLRTLNAGEDTWKSLSVPGNDADAFSQWVSHIQDGTRADDNLTRAVVLTRLVSAANTAAATGATVRYGMSTA
jgi:1,5-anhydro-D-fructose reductase (1,5-anhydro-D-mannitol-forming)